MTNQLGIYVHIPFCVNKCAYCDFYSLTDGNGPLMDEYLEALLAHIRETAAFTGKELRGGGRMVDSIYFGGGTPVLFGTKRLSAVLKAVWKGWNVSRGAEITIEGNPESFGLKPLKKLRKMGFNRVSVGVQAVQDELLQTLGRVHNAEQAADAVRMAQKAKFENIGVDVMYGIPGQTADHLEQTLESVVSWDVQHISVYGLKVEEGTPLYEKRELLKFPPDEAQAQLYLATVCYLEKHGFAQYEISNFARPSRHSRHNMKYWQLDPYLGFGPSAHSDFGGKRYSHVRSLRDYIDGVKNSGTVIDEMESISNLDRAGEYVMCGLRTVKGISGNEYTRLYKVNFDIIEEKLEKYQKMGLVARVSDRWRLTPEGFMVSNRILAELLESEPAKIAR